ncbi:hypothetical protein IV203_037154 [Nitzschia inconspicua]|uniref:Uncharacterized protein n=1 Tax=Nitzschia inconspicua TaxID=303405 RepID=A0A9K3LKV6_9STRA|nr:hypothetical protein IV203_037154 [Nitzschia inconspicua]
MIYFVVKQKSFLLRNLFDGTAFKRLLRIICSFRNVADLKLNGCYLQRLTVKPVTGIYKDRYDVEEEDGGDILNEAMDQFFLSKSLELGYDNEFRDSSGRFQCQSILTRCHGSHRYGKNLVVCPNVQSSERFIVVEGTETRPSKTNETDVSKCERHLDVKALNELALKAVTKDVDKNGRAIDIEVNGTLQNVREFAELHFCHDMEQMRSFEIIICAFIDKLYKEAEKNCNRNQQK